MASESESSPPQSRGRGRFEKGRAKAGSRGQSEDTRSTSSQAADEESSSHVRRRSPIEWSVLSAACGPRSLWLSLSMCFPAGPLPFACQRGRRRPALWLLSRWRGRERDEGHAPHRQLQKSGCTLQVHGKLVARVRGWSGDLIWRMYINSVATLTVTCDLFPAFFLGDGAADHDVTR